MEFKKCDRCGCFFVSDGNTCVNCSPKDKLEINKLKNFLDGATPDSGTNIDALSYNTGITIKNLNRFLCTDEFAGIAKELGIINNEEISNGNIENVEC